MEDIPQSGWSFAVLHVQNVGTPRVSHYLVASEQESDARAALADFLDASDEVTRATRVSGQHLRRRRLASGDVFPLGRVHKTGTGSGVSAHRG